MNPRVSFTIVGIFVVLLGTALIAGIVWLSSAAEDRKYRTYVAYFTESVSGLSDNSSVTWRGVDVGNVRSIEIDRDNPERVRVLLAILQDTPVKEDTVAILVSKGITGLVNVELTGGSRDAPSASIRGRAEYPEIETGPSLLVRLDTAATSLVAELVTTAAEIRAVAENLEALLGADNRESITAILDHIEALTGGLDSQVGGLDGSVAHIQTILANSAIASQSLPELVGQTTDAFEVAQQTFLQVGDAADSFGAASERVDIAVSTIDSALAAVEGVLNELQLDMAVLSRNTPSQLEQLIGELQLVSESMRRLSLNLERDPNMLFVGRPETPRGPGEE